MPLKWGTMRWATRSSAGAVGPGCWWAVFGLALTLFVAVTALWIRSYLRYDRVRYIGPEDEQRRYLCITLDSLRGAFSVSFVEYRDVVVNDRSTGYTGVKLETNPAYRYVRSRPDWGLARFDWTREELDRVELEWTSVKGELPYWCPWLASGLPLAVAHGLRRRRMGRRGAGCCLRCGYDLRASPDRCPECGTPMGVTTDAAG